MAYFGPGSPFTVVGPIIGAGQVGTRKNFDAASME